MASEKFVAYYRVSTRRQGQSGLGLEAQQKAVRDWLNGGRWELVEEFTETESGGKGDRPKLQAALAACRVRKATLVIAKLDRLARDAHFLLGLQKEGVRFRAVDMPEANEMVVGIMACIAQGERKMISDRTKAALKAAKARGVKLGGYRGVRGYTPTAQDRRKASRALTEKANRIAQDYAHLIGAIRDTGVTSLNGISKALNAQGVPSPRGGLWQSVTVKRVLERLA